MIAISTPEAPYESVARHIREMIEKGDLPVGARLPSIRDLAKLLGLAENTVKAGYRLLEQQRLVTNNGLLGRHVAEPINPVHEFNVLVDTLRNAGLSTTDILAAMKAVQERLK